MTSAEAHRRMQVHTFAAALEARLALRKAARLEPNPAKRGWITRKLNRP